jgi:hypothetical protein
VGQLVTSKAALDLLAVRADSSDRTAKDRRPWPELAEYSCYACHQDLKVLPLDSDPETLKRYETRSPGSFPYGTWYLSALPPLNGDPGYLPPAILSDLKELRGLMERPAPKATAVSAKAKAISATLAEALKKIDPKKPIEVSRLGALTRKYLDEGHKNAKVLTWDEATQVYLALAALSQGMTDLGSPTFSPGKGRDELLAVKNRLKHAFLESGYDSPKKYNPMEPMGGKTLAEQLKSLRSLLGN